MTERVPAPAELLRRLRPIPTYRDHPATVGRDIEGVDPWGARHRIEIVGSDEPVLLLFLSSTCLGCRDFWEGAGQLGADVPGVRLVIVTRGPETEDAGAVAELASWAQVAGSACVEVVMSPGAYLDYGVSGPPFFAVTVGSEVRTEGVAWGVGETAELVRRSLAAPEAP